MKQQHILVVDDDLPFCLMMKGYLRRQGFSVATASDARQAQQLIMERTPALVLTDFRLPDVDGLELLKKFRASLPSVPVILMTSYGDIRMAVQAMREGAVDYLAKPIQPDELVNLIRTNLNGKTSGGALANSKAEVSEAKDIFVSGQSASSKELERHIDLVAPTAYSVLIIGESGTGKEFVARRIHQKSPRRNGPFVAIDCGALTGELAAAEFFGHLKGAFTGATGDRSGVFEQASGGTIFLDEIGNLSYDNQVKLLRVIQEKKVRRLGATQDIDVDVRIITATNEDLSEAIRAGNFREDLYHRIHEFSLHLPPLRSRIEDQEIFAAHFLEMTGKELGREFEGFSPEAMEMLIHYPWPGNLREMKNVIKRAALLSSESVIVPDALPLEIRLAYLDLPKTAKPEHKHVEPLSLSSAKEQLEKEKIREALEKFRYNRTKTAAALGIDRKTLYYKMKNYGMS